MYYKKYEGKRIYLSPMNIDDYKIYTRWLNDETLSRGLGNMKYLFGEENEKEWIERESKGNNYNFSIIDKNTDTMIGSYGLEVKDNVSRRFHVGGFIGEKEDRGKGYGTEALELVTKFAFEILNANTLYSGIFSFNEPSLMAAKKAGYKIAGKFREAYFYNGVYYDEYLVEITKKDYLKHKKSKEIVRV